MVQICKMITSPGIFFNVKILIFQVVKRLKGQKLAQNVEDFCLSHIIRGEGEVKGQKMTQILSVSFRISGIVHDMIVIFGAHVEMMMSQANFFILQNFDFWGF